MQTISVRRPSTPLKQSRYRVPSATCFSISSVYTMTVNRFYGVLVGTHFIYYDLTEALRWHCQAMERKERVSHETQEAYEP